jgi:uncharacterized protein YjdB
MLEKVTLSRVSFIEKDKDGNPLRSKTGKPYTRCLIDATDGRKMSGFANQTNRNWRQGDTVEVEVEQNGQYWNFKMPEKKAEGVNQEQLDRIEKMVTALYNRLATIPGTPVAQPTNRMPDYPEEEIRPEDIPF